LAVWERRQRGVVVLLWIHAVALMTLGVVRGLGVAHSIVEGGVVGLFAILAMQPAGSARLRSAAATFGLISSSAILVHMSGGTIEAHFHFFAMIGIITLYQDWVPFGLAIAFVAVHHGVASTLDAGSVYNHYAALNNPWKWAAIHGAFVLGASAANVFAWRLNEEAASETEAYRLRAEEGERRRRSALEINDNVVQGLAVITSALALGENGVARDAANRTIDAARTIISDLLGDGGAAVTPGSLRREAPADGR
jgi:signal transduction histidine kinase